MKKMILQLIGDTMLVAVVLAIMIWVAWIILKIAGAFIAFPIWVIMRFLGIVVFACLVGFMIAGAIEAVKEGRIEK